ncbi:MAG: PEP-CTERM sorting domain-containing protein [Phycisphaerae bacterium]|nr:PEP-CTERM sorting domain-containing protein [Phycisphaerae bacterium]
MKTRTLAMGLVMFCVLAGAATLSSGAMVAQWTFLDLNDSAGATNDALTLAPGSAGTSELLTGEGYESGVLKNYNGGMGSVLRSSELSFQSGSTFTIWTRIKLGYTDPVECYELFRNETGSGGFTFRVNDSSGMPLRFRAVSDSTAGLGIGDTEWHNVGIRIFMAGSQQKAEFYLDGASTGMNVSLFSDFGRDYDICEAGGGATIYVEEMRIYDEFLSDAQMDAIEHVVPEPATMSLLGLGGLGVLLRRKR